MAAGRVSEDQAVVIVKGVDALPVEHRREAENHLIGLAAEHDPVALRRIAHHILEVVAPEIAEEHQLKALQRQEALAEEACRFTIADDGHGLCHGRFTLPAPVGAMLKQAVLAINSPKHRRHSGTPNGLGHAFCEYVTRYPIRPAPPGRRRRRHRGGHHDPGEPARRQPGTSGVGHRGPDHRRPGPQARLRGRDHPDGPGWEVQDPRPRTPQTPLRPVPADRDQTPRPALHSTRMRLARQPCATSTTTPPGAEAGRPTSPTDACSARGTTPTHTHRSTR